jgi:hypothetical protein
VRELLLIDPRTLEVLATHALPAPRIGFDRILDFLANPDKLFTDTSGAAYFFLDSRDRAVVPTSNRSIAIVGVVESPPEGRPELRRLSTLDVSRDSSARPQGIPDGDKLAVVLPDWHVPDSYWFTSTKGLVGLAEAGSVRSVSLRTLYHPEERITNGFAVGRNGVFIVSDRALYCFRRSDSGMPAVRWRREYEPGARKPGQIGPGSGTTPTLLGHKYVAFCDNAEPMNVLIVDQETGDEVSRHRALKADKSACENSPIGYKFGLVVVNTYGYKSPFSGGGSTVGGMTRLDVDPASGRCRQRWTRGASLPLNIWSTTPKLSSPDGIIYAYTRVDRGSTRMWVVVGVNFETGETVFSLPISPPDHKRIPGAGWLDFFDIDPGDWFRGGERIDIFDNSWGPTYLGSNSWGTRSVLVSMIEGFLKIDLSE